MVELGKWLVIFGAGSFALNSFGMEFKLLMWIDSWGPEVGNAIRVGFIVVGAICLAIGMKTSEAVAEESFDDIEAPSNDNAEVRPSV